MKECASGNAIVVHRNVRSDALLMYTSTELPTSGADLFGIGYGRGALTLIVRYDTRVRVVASYGCTIKLGLDEATVTGGHFFSGGTKIDIMPDCGPGSWIDIIAEDWRLLASGKKRLKWDVSCGDIATCTDPALPPPLPTNPSPSPTRTVPAPPPFPPNTKNLPPSAPPPPSSPAASNASIAVAAAAAVALLAFGCLGVWVSCLGGRVRRGDDHDEKLVPVAVIARDGTSSVVQGRRVVRVIETERQSLLYGN